MADQMSELRELTEISRAIFERVQVLLQEAEKQNAVWARGPAVEIAQQAGRIADIASALARSSSRRAS